VTKAKSSLEVRVVLSPAEVAALFGVDPKTVTTWAKQKKLPFFTTPGGHRRYYLDDVQPLLNKETPHDEP